MGTFILKRKTFTFGVTQAQGTVAMIGDTSKLKNTKTYDKAVSKLTGAQNTINQNLGEAGTNSYAARRKFLQSKAGQEAYQARSEAAKVINKQAPSVAGKAGVTVTKDTAIATQRGIDQGMKMGAAGKIGMGKAGLIGAGLLAGGMLLGHTLSGGGNKDQQQQQQTIQQ